MPTHKPSFQENRDLHLLDFKDDTVQLLVTLGLTMNQAKIYLSNLHSGQTTAKVLSHISGIGREDVYRMLPSLQEKGLIFRYISSPTLFEAISLKDAISVLLRQKEKQFFGLREKVDVFISNVNDQIQVNKAEINQEITLFSRINPERSPIVRDIKQTKEICCYTTWYCEFLHIVNSIEFETIVREQFRAMKRGVKIRVVMDKPETKKLFDELSYDLPVSKNVVRHKNFQYKYTTLPTESVLLLLDNKVLYLWTISKHFLVMPFLRTSNYSLIDLAKTYFSVIWEKAEKPAPSNTNS